MIYLYKLANNDNSFHFYILQFYCLGVFIIYPCLT